MDLMPDFSFLLIRLEKLGPQFIFRYSFPLHIKGDSNLRSYNHKYEVKTRGFLHEDLGKIMKTVALRTSSFVQVVGSTSF